jgi:hypothetical protein
MPTAKELSKQLKEWYPKGDEQVALIAGLLDKSEIYDVIYNSYDDVEDYEVTDEMFQDVVSQVANCDNELNALWEVIKDVITGEYEKRIHLETDNELWEA